MGTSGPKWDPEVVLFDRVKDHMARFYGLAPNLAVYKRVLRKFDPNAQIMPDGIYVGDKKRAGTDSLIDWITGMLLDTPDGITDIIREGPTEPVNRQSALYNAVLETLRTSRGTFFSAEQIAERVHYSLDGNRRRRLRQMRRLLLKICKNEGVRRQVGGKNKVAFGFR